MSGFAHTCADDELGGCASRKPPTIFHRLYTELLPSSSTVLDPESGFGSTTFDRPGAGGAASGPRDFALLSFFFGG